MEEDNASYWWPSQRRVEAVLQHQFTDLNNTQSPYFKSVRYGRHRKLKYQLALADQVTESHLVPPIRSELEEEEVAVEEEEVVVVVVSQYLTDNPFLRSSKSSNSVNQ